MTAQPEVRCGCRRHEVTVLRCSRCLAPICPECSIPGPIGSICKTCGGDKLVTVLEAAPGPHLAAAFFIAAPVAGLIARYLLNLLRGLGFFGLWVGLFAGVLIGEMCLLATQRKRGRLVEASAIMGLVAGAAAGLYLRFESLPEWHTADTGLQTYLTQALTGWPILCLAAAIVGVFSRLRNL